MHRSSISAIALAALAAATVTASAQDGGLLLPPATHQQPSQQAQAPAPPAQVGQPARADDSDAAFEEALRTLAPLTPEQIEQVRRRLDGVERAQGAPLSPVQPVTRSVAVSLRSGEAPATIRTAPGWISTLTFSDVTGRPWPVLSVTNGNPDAYDVKSSGPENESNIITISSRQAHVPSNIAITLVGAQVPILLTLYPSPSGEIDFRVDAQIDQRGPNASYDVVSSVSLPATGDSLMLGFLDGVPPQGAVRMQTSARDVQAWRFDDMLYVRTGRSLLSPAFVAKQSNASGVNVYVLKEAPVLMVSDEGRLENVQVRR